ncbi:MAG: exosortase/archaeosortase family protein [Bryobacterales bacterium]|nr:exosortase/archaeosortase family protein [Bryobacterales bacterium]
MSQTATASETVAGEASRPNPPVFWYALAALIAGALLVYLPTLSFLVRNWIDDEDMGHGFFVPLVAGYLIWVKRDKILQQEYTPNYWGLPVVLLGAIQMLVAHLGVELFLARVAFLVTLVGIVLFYGGTRLLRTLAFPLGLLIFMIPIPAIIYNQITFPLQLFASQVAEVTLGFLGIPVLREGNILELPSQRLSVVEACSGIRSLLALSFLSLTYAAVFDDKRWMRPVLLIMTVPIAILSNAFRVTLTGLFSEVNPEFAKGLFHTMEGSVIYLMSLAMLFLTHRLINRAWSRYAHRPA